MDSKSVKGSENVLMFDQMIYPEFTLLFSIIIFRPRI